MFGHSAWHAGSKPAQIQPNRITWPSPAPTIVRTLCELFFCLCTTGLTRHLMSSSDDARFLAPYGRCHTLSLPPSSLSPRFSPLQLSDAPSHAKHQRQEHDPDRAQDPTLQPPHAPATRQLCPRARSIPRPIDRAMQPEPTPTTPSPRRPFVVPASMEFYWSRYSSPIILSVDECN
jgi:hypothetical protein